MTKQSGKQASRRESTDNSSHELVKKPKLISETKITDLNYDCLYSVFKWMPIHHTIAMSGVCKKFVEPTKWIVRGFNSKHIFSVSQNTWCFGRPAFYKTLFYMPSCRIKCIGQSLSKIFLDYEGTFEDSVSVVEDSILKYCTELTELTLVNGKSTPFESIKMPIAKLKVLNLNNCILGPVFCQFSEWLPQLRTLSVINCYVLDADARSCIGKMGRTMPALESIHLDVVRKFNPNDDEWSKRNAHCNTDEIIKRNGHVKCFRTTSDTHPRRLLNISKSMERLETLEFQAKKIQFEGSSNEPINFKWVKTLVMKISGYGRFTCPLVFDSLEELDITCDDFSEPWMFFARSNQIKKLKLYVVRNRTHLNDLLAISSTWPSLIEVSMHLSCVPFDEIIVFIHSLSNLRRFNFLKFVCQYSSKTESEKFEEVKLCLSDEFEIVPGTDVNRFSLVRSNGLN